MARSTQRWVSYTQDLKALSYILKNSDTYVKSDLAKRSLANLLGEGRSIM